MVTHRDAHMYLISEHRDHSVDTHTTPTPTLHTTPTPPTHTHTHTHTHTLHSHPHYNLQGCSPVLRCYHVHTQDLIHMYTGAR